MKGRVTLTGKYFRKNTNKKSIKKFAAGAVAVACSAALSLGLLPWSSMSAFAQSPIYARTTDYLNLRTGRGTGYGVIEVLDDNAQVTVLDTSDPDWLKVQSGNKTGYCSADYLDIITDAKALGSLSLKRIPSSSGATVASITDGARLDVLGYEEGNWVQVKLGSGEVGYVQAASIEYVDNSYKEPSVTVPAEENLSGKLTQMSSSSSFTLSNSLIKIAKGNTWQLTANGATKLTWVSTNKKVATVTSSGLVKGVDKGEASITVFDSATGKSQLCRVKVYNTDYTSIKLSDTTKTIAVSKSFTLKATTVPTANKKVFFKSYDTSVAKVDSNGKVTGVGKGSCVIKAYDSTGIIHAKCRVTVNTQDWLKLSQTTMTIDRGQSRTLLVTKSRNDLNVRWSSSDLNVASVNDGRVSGLKAGTATVTASDSTGTVKAVCKVTVNNVNAGSLSLSHSSVSACVGKTIYVKAYGNGKYATADGKIASFSNDYIVCHKAGRTAIRYCDNNGHSAVCIVNVSEAASARFAYCSPNSAVKGSAVKLVAITDKTRQKVCFKINIGGKEVEVNATSKVADGDTYVWTGSYTPQQSGEFTVSTYSFKDNKWQTCNDGKCTMYVSNKTNFSTTALQPLRASDKLIAFIGEKEGFTPKITPDTLANNVPTIGYGQVMWAGDSFYNNLTEKEAFAMLIKSVNGNSFTSAVNNMLINNNTRFNQQQFDALVSFTYNLGAGWTYGSDLKDILLNSYGSVSSDSTMTGTVTASDGLNIRKGATTSADIITAVPYGTRLTLVSTQKYNSVWYKVKTPSGVVGYCSGTYLKISSSSSTTGRDLNYVNKNALIKEMLAYHHAGGNCYYGLLYRRVDELEMFLYNDYVSDGRSNKHNFPDTSCLAF